MNAESTSLSAFSGVVVPPAPIAPPQISMQTVRLLAYAVLALLDFVAIVAAFAIASVVRQGAAATSQSVPACCVTFLVFAGIALNSGAYSSAALERSRTGVRRAGLALLFAVGVTVLAAFFFKVGDDFSRLMIAGAALLGLVFIAVGRIGFGVAIKRWLRWRPVDELVIVDGVDVAEAGRPDMLDATQAGLRPDSSDPLMLDRLARALAGRDRVIVACGHDRRNEWALVLKGANINGFVLAPELDEIGMIDAEHFAGSSLLRISCGPLDLRNRALKRALDLALAVPALLVLLPLLLATALAIKLDSDGPVFFQQERVGRGNRLFLILKFRSMRIDACDGAGDRSTSRDDDRITRVGRLIRATSIDELPQLLNVLLGDMSFVGPRPHALGSTAGDQLFWEVDRRYWDRHATKPGITGLAQVRGFRGATHQRSDLESRLQADLEYISGWTIWRDVSILMRTIRVVVHKNAY